MEALLATDRMTLRAFAHDDAPLLIELDADREVLRHVDPFADLVPRSPGALEAYVRERFMPRLLRPHERLGRGFWAAVCREDARFLGWFQLEPKDASGLEAELGCRLRREVWGLGYATEGATALVSHALEVGVQRVTASTLAVNVASIRVLQKAGLRFTGDGSYRGLPTVEFAREREAA